MNSWFDFGMGKGGNIITLASYLYASDSLPYLLDKIEKQAPHVRPIDSSFPQQASEPSFERLEVRELNHPALLRYLSERNIDLRIARKECVELHFSHDGLSFFSLVTLGEVSCLSVIGCAGLCDTQLHKQRGQGN